jgi:hypothetical protein
VAACPHHTQRQQLFRACGTVEAFTGATLTGGGPVKVKQVGTGPPQAHGGLAAGAVPTCFNWPVPRHTCSTQL